MPVEISCDTPVASRDTPTPSSGCPRLTYVINSFDRGGAEAGLLELARGGLFKGFEVKIVALVRGTGGLESTLTAMGHHPEILLDTERMRSADLPAIFLRLWRFLGDYAPHVTISSLPQANLLVRVWLGFHRQVLGISFEHNTHLAKRIYEIGFRLTSSRIDWMFADAAMTLQEASKRLYRQVPALRSVVPLVSFEGPARRHVGPSAVPFRIINAARFTTVKNQAALIEALAKLRRDGRHVSLTLYGEGPEQAACRELASRLDVSEHVGFPGFVPDWSKSAADLFVLASRHEGLCLVVLQAMHAGIPVAAPILGGMRDYATPAVLLPLADVDPGTIAAAVAAAMDDRASLLSRVERAADMIDRRYGADAVRCAYAQLNQVLLKEALSRAARSESDRRGRAAPLF